jgi:hypothetical protein
MQVDITLDSFLSKVRQRNTTSDGTVIDPNLFRRFDNPICQKCHADYKVKYPDKPFSIKCNGIFDERDYQEYQQDLIEVFPEDPILPIEDPNGLDIRQMFDVPYWASKHILLKDEEGHLAPFAGRDYQVEALLCTASQKVDRWARGLGKSVTGRIEELHKLTQTPGLDTLVVCPADTQSNSWYEGFIEDISNSPTLSTMISDKKQNPYRLIKFNNGAIVRIVTAGSASGRKATSLRGFDPRRVRIDEQDYLVEADWGAISPLLTRHQNSEFHGSSTPTGDRSKFWEMCTKDIRYKEFYNPITKHPHWGPDMEMACRSDARTEDRYRFEFLAEFGDPTQGVFKNMYVDFAKKPYFNPAYPSLKGYDTCTFDSSKEYYMGVDWNGQGTGTRIRVVEYDPITKLTRVVGAYAVVHEGFTAFDSIDAIEKYNRKWHCRKIYVDAGYGASQFDMLRVRGLNSNDVDTMKLRDVVSIDFGAKLTFNKIVPNRQLAGTRYTNDEEFDRRTKPYLVEGAVMMFEQQLIQFSETDKVLEDQLRSYRVATYAKGGQADTYKTDATVGDHDLDAFMLALLGVELAHGLYSTPDVHRRRADFTYTGAFGLPTGATSPQQAVEDKKLVVGIPNRNKVATNNDQLRIAHLQRNSFTVMPNKETNTGNHNSRTAIFGNRSGRTPPRPFRGR